MPHSYTQTHVHLVFGTKERQKLISKELQPRLWSYVAAICKNQKMPALSVGGISDHIHVLFRLPPTITLVRAVTLIKSNSSKWIREKRTNFSWQGATEHSTSASQMSMRSSSILTTRRHITASSRSNRNSSRCSRSTTFRSIRSMFSDSVAAYGSNSFPTVFPGLTRLGYALSPFGLAACNR